MKKKLLGILIVISFKTFNAQNTPIVFCPPGAEWRYQFNYWMSAQTYIARIKYIKDSIVDNATVKVLNANYFFLGCEYIDIIPPYYGYTLIKQKGDTIFMRNTFTGHSWQILYNFAAQPGSVWGNKLGGASLFGYYNTKVDSVTSISVNNFPLKKMYVTRWYSGDGSYPVYLETKSTIVERFGFGEYLFHYFLFGGGCESNGFQKPLCYQDDEFGITNLSQRGCQVVNLEVELRSEYNIRLFPNPANTVLYLESDQFLPSDKFQAVITDLQSREVKRIELKTDPSHFDIRNLAPGIYFVSITQSGKLIYTTKLVKQD